MGREAQRRRSLLPVRLRRLYPKPVVLVKDRKGRLSSHREFTEEDPRPGDVVRQMVCAALPENQCQALLKVIAPLQSFAKSHYYLSCVQKIQRIWRGHRSRK